MKDRQLREAVEDLKADGYAEIHRGPYILFADNTGYLLSWFGEELSSGLLEKRHLLEVEIKDAPWAKS